MKRIILLIDANNPNTGSMDFGCRIAALTRTRLTGLFISSETDEEISSGQQFYHTLSAGGGTEVISSTEEAVQIFREKCRMKGVEAEVRRETGEPVREVIFQSRYADLIIVDPAISFYHGDEEVPTYFMRQILLKSECPILLAPWRSQRIEEVVFCYDGSPESVYAIKQFTFLFPEFHEKNLLLLHTQRSLPGAIDENLQAMQDWLGAYYRSVAYQHMETGAPDELFAWFFTKEKKLIIMGAYENSEFPFVMRKNMADVLIRNIDLPLFIANR